MSKMVSNEVLKELTNKLEEIINNYCWNLQHFTDDEVEGFFQASSDEITYCNSIINDKIESKNFIWSSKCVAEKIANALIEAESYSDTLIKNISSIKLKYVTILPTSDINENTIYILKASGTTAKDTLNLYNDTNGWTSIGNFEISMDNYYNKTEIDTLLADKAKASEVVANDKIVQDLTSTSTDTVLSAKGIETLLNSKANVSDISKVVTNSVVEYYVSTSSTELSGGTWSTDSPKWESGKYIWSRNKTTLKDGTVQYSAPVCIQGAKGETGATGKGIKSVEAEYYMSTSKTSQTDGSWVTTCPQWEANHYLWTRSKITYTDGTSEYVGLQVDSSWEAVNLVEVGGRNLLVKKDLQNGYLNKTTGDLVSSNDYNKTTDYIYVKDYNYITVTLYDSFTLPGYYASNQCIFYDKDKNYISESVSSFKFNEPSFKTIKIPDESYYARLTLLYGNTKKYKIEKGNISTDYAEAPEDTQEQIDDVVQRVSTAEQKITSDAIISTVTTSEVYKNDLNSKANKSNVTDTDKIDVTIPTNSEIVAFNNNYNFYRVKNGICYMSLDLQVLKVGLAVTNFITGLPKPNELYHVPIHSFLGDGTILVVVNTDGSISIYRDKAVANERYISSFSYPVAES